MRMRYRMERRQARVRRDFKKSGIRVRLLQGLFIIAAGVVIVLVNVASLEAPFQKVTGHITQTQERSVAGVYDASYLSIDKNDDFFILNKNAFHPTWDDGVYRGQKVDVYYHDGTPRNVVALVLYDSFDGSSKAFTTSEYDNALKNPANPSLGLFIGGIIVLIGWIWFVCNLWLAVWRRGQH